MKNCTSPLWPVFLFIMIFGHSASQAWSNTSTPFSLSLITAETLNQTRADYVILDARSKHEWNESHLPEALSVNWDDFTHVDENGIAYRILPPEGMAALLGPMGIDENTAVAIYGDADTSWGGEGWVAWALAYLGHQGPVMILDGGIQAWKAQKLPMKTDKTASSKPMSKTYHANPNLHVDIETADLSQHISQLQIVDTRSFFERIRGSIPGSVHISWTKFYTGDTRKPITRDQLVSLLRDNGIDPDKPVVYYCTGGVRSAYAWMVHQLAGLGPARNYEGGTEAWNKKDQRP